MGDTYWFAWGVMSILIGGGVAASSASSLPDIPKPPLVDSNQFVCPDETSRFLNPLPPNGSPDEYPYIFNCLPVGIRPGSMISAGQISGCTMNFIFTDGTDFYFGTAGHCIGGLSYAVEVEGEGIVGRSVFRAYTADESDPDPLDFALVRIDPAKRDRINPAVAFWGGPTGLATEYPVGAEYDVEEFAEEFPRSTESLVLKMYGNGLGFYATYQTRARVGVLHQWRHNTVTYLTARMDGDSGAPVMTADGLAVASHKGVGSLPWDWGFQIARGMELADAALGVHLELVTAPLSGVHY